MFFVSQAIPGLSAAKNAPSNQGPPDSDFGEDNPTKGEKFSEKDASTTQKKDKGKGKATEEEHQGFAGGSGGHGDAGDAMFDENDPSYVLQMEEAKRASMFGTNVVGGSTGMTAEEKEADVERLRVEAEIRKSQKAENEAREKEAFYKQQDAEEKAKFAQEKRMAQLKQQEYERKRMNDPKVQADLKREGPDWDMARELFQGPCSPQNQND